MRILYFSRDYTIHDRRFLSKIADSGHDVFFLRLEDDGHNYEKRRPPEGVQVVEWAGGREKADTPDDWLRLMPDFESVLDRIRPDIVQAGPVQSCGYMAALSGFHPFILVSWGSDILVHADRDEEWRRMTRFALERADMFLCDCDPVRKKAQQIFPFPDDRIIRFPWGIDLKMFSPGAGRVSIRGQLGWDDCFIILSTRSWEPIYSIDILLDAFRIAHSKNPALRLIMLGGGSLAPKVEQYIKENGLDNSVSRPGTVSQELSANYFRASDLYLSCALSDGTSISLLEAMATRLPAVVTDAPGNREWVRNGENGWLARAGDPASYAERIVRASRLNRSEIQKIGDNNRAAAESRADWDCNVQLLIDAYKFLKPDSPF